MKSKVRSIDSPWGVSADEIPKIFKHEETNPGVNFWAKPSDLERLIDEAEVNSIWDFNSALGDTIMEKYESLYLKLVEIHNIIERKGAKGYFWIAARREITAIFETTAGFQPSFSDLFLSESNIINLGKVNARWQIFSCEDIPVGKLLMGVNNQEEDSSHYATVYICNFII